MELYDEMTIKIVGILRLGEPNNMHLYAALLIETLQARVDQLEKDLTQYQTPMLVIQENWNPSVCPRCNNKYYDYEECNDGYYYRATSLGRCPYCGQKLKWEDD